MLRLACLAIAASALCVLVGIACTTRTAPAAEEIATARTTPELGDFLAFQIVEGHFGLDRKAVTARLPDDVREVAQVWVLFYLAWVYDVLVAAEHGPEFRDRMIQQTRSRLRLANNIQQGEGDLLVQHLDGYFAALNQATSAIGTKINGVEVPFEVFAAMSLLTLDAGSPYYHQASLPDGIEFDVGEVLAVALQERRDFIQNAVRLLK